VRATDAIHSLSEPEATVRLSDSISSVANLNGASHLSIILALADSERDGALAGILALRGHSTH
jgi:hypothetical protein